VSCTATAGEVVMSGLPLDTRDIVFVPKLTVVDDTVYKGGRLVLKRGNAKLGVLPVQESGGAGAI
jgi:hypothetical protein